MQVREEVFHMLYTKNRKVDNKNREKSRMDS